MNLSICFLREKQRWLVIPNHRAGIHVRAHKYTPTCLLTCPLHTHTCTCKRAHTHSHTQTCTHMDTHSHMHTQALPLTHVCAGAHTNVHTCIQCLTAHTCTRMCTHMDTYSPMHTQVHTPTCTHIYSYPLSHTRLSNGTGHLVSTACGNLCLPLCGIQPSLYKSAL